MLRTVLLPFAVSLLVPFLHSQDAGKTRATLEAEMTEAELAEAELTDDGDKPSEDGKVANPIDAGPVNGLERYMAPVLSFKPRRLGPGEAGELHIVLAMQNSTVLTSTAFFDVQLPPELGPALLGGWQLGAPREGELDTKFRGQPVHDNFAHVVVPIQVAKDAQYGDYPVSIGIVADVTDGDSGAVRGRMQTRARGTLQIGDPMPRPVPQAGDASDAGDPVASSGAESMPTDAGAAIDDGRPVREEVGAADAEPSGAAGDPESGPAPAGSLVMPSSSAWVDWLWYGLLGLGAVVILALVISAARR